MPPRRKSVSGVVTTVQAVLLLMYAVFFILNAYCYVDFFGKSVIGTGIKIMYLHDPGLCGQRINIGELVDGMPQQAFVQMQQAPFTYYRTLYFNWTNIVLAILWLISNELVFRNITMIPWAVVTVAVCLLDFLGLLVYLNDSFATKTLPNLLSYIGADAFGTGNVLLQTSTVAPVMSFIISKCMVFVIINSVLLIWHSIPPREHNFNNIDVEAAPASPIPPLIRGNIARVPIRLPRPKVYRNDRCESNIRLRDIKAACSNEHTFRPVPGHARRELPTVMPHQDPPPSPNQLQPAFSADDIRKIQVPDTILSLPQRIEKLIAEESRKYEITPSTSSGGVGEPRERIEGSKTDGVRRLVYFPEFAVTLPRELEDTMNHQKQCLDTFTYYGHPKYNNPGSISLPNLTDDIYYPRTNELYYEYKAWYFANDFAAGAHAWKTETGFNSRLCKQLRPRNEPHFYNLLAQTESMYREESVEHLAYPGKLKRLIFFSLREQPDVLY